MYISVWVIIIAVVLYIWHVSSSKKEKRTSPLENPTLAKATHGLVFHNAGLHHFKTFTQEEGEKPSFAGGIEFFLQYDSLRDLKYSYLAFEPSDVNFCVARSVDKHVMILTFSKSQEAYDAGYFIRVFWFLARDIRELHQMGEDNRAGKTHPHSLIISFETPKGGVNRFPALCVNFEKGKAR